MSFLLDKKSKIRRESKDQRIKADIIGPIAQSGRFPAMSAVARAPSPVEGGRSPEEGYRNRTLYLFDFGNPNDIANACSYLLSDASRWVTGSNLVVDGGVYDEVFFK